MTGSLQAQVINAGIGGNTTVDLLERVEVDVLSQNPDLVILMAGTNDMLNSKKMISFKSYQENLGALISTIRGGGAEVLLMSPPPVDSAYLFMRHDRALFEQVPNAKLDTVKTIVESLQHQEGIYFLDLNDRFKALNLPNHNKDLFIKNAWNSGKQDGVHPTALGYHFIAANVFQFLKDHQLLDQYDKIICFGDSITYGGGLESSYPAVLQELLNHPE
ncbi:MAG: hypothetical protein JXQ90_04720 [Cyclobacteriaceae bacterium]